MSITQALLASYGGLLSPTSVEYLIIAGGAGGGAGGVGGSGGGGAGGYRTGTASVTAGTTYTITIGGGGANRTAVFEIPGQTGGNGGNSSAFSITSTGGGGGGGAGGYDHNLILQQEVVVDLVEEGAVLTQILLKQVLMVLEHLGKEIMEELEVLQLHLLVEVVEAAVLGPSEQMLLDRLEELVERVLLQVSLDLP